VICEELQALELGGEVGEGLAHAGRFARRILAPTPLALVGALDALDATGRHEVYKMLGVEAGICANGPWR
jgi:hypothetical protein